MTSRYPIAMDTISNPVLETQSGDPFYVLGKNPDSNVQRNGTLMLSQVVDIESYTLTHKDTNNFEHSIYHEHIKFRVYTTDFEYFNIMFDMPVDAKSGLKRGDFVRVLCIDNVNILWEHSASNVCFVKYNIDFDTEVLPHSTPLPDTNWESVSNKEYISSADTKFTYKSKAKHDLILNILIVSSVILVLFCIAVAVYFVDSGMPIPYFLGAMSVFFVFYAIWIVRSGIKQIKVEEQALAMGTLCLARVIEVNKHVHNDSTIFINVYTNMDIIPLEVTISNSNQPQISRGDYIRVMYVDNSTYVVEGDTARGIFYRYRLNKSYETLRFD